MALVKRHKAVVLASGGMDSTLTAAFAYEKFDLAFLHVNYGQRTESRELKAFHDVADYYRVKERLITDIGYLKKIGGSSLTDRKIKVAKADLKNKSVPSTYVPFRNANLLSIAVSWAEVIGARSVFIGAVEEDSSGYPDCRKEFFKAYEKMISLGTKPGTKIKIETPIIDFTKEKIVRYSFKMNAPLHLTWSCYSSGDKACGVCDSCALRLRGFQMAGRIDPIPYKKILKY